VRHRSAKTTATSVTSAECFHGHYQLSDDCTIVLTLVTSVSKVTKKGVDGFHATKVQVDCEPENS